MIERIKDLKGIISGSKDKKGLQDKLKMLTDEVIDNLERMRDMLDKYPNYIDLMIATNKEMKVDSGPDDTADYWEERKRIDRHLSELAEDKLSLASLEKQVTPLEKAANHTL